MHAVDLFEHVEHALHDVGRRGHDGNHRNHAFGLVTGGDAPQVDVEGVEHFAETVFQPHHVVALRIDLDAEGSSALLSHGLLLFYKG